MAPRDLTSSEVDRLSSDGTWRVSHGLYLQIRGGTRSWLLRYRWKGKQLWMGLGPTRLITLTEAKRRAQRAQVMLLDGINPLDARNAERRTTSMTFEEAADACIKALKPQWRSGDVQETQWRNQIGTYAFPIIGSMSVDNVEMNDVVKVLEQIWVDKTESATRLRERLEKVFDWAISAGHRSGQNPARWKGGLAHLLPKPSAIQKKEHHKAIVVADAPRVYRAITSRPQTTARLLQFIALTAVRFSEAAKATWSEVDFDGRVWTIPAARTKVNRELRVPLCDEAIRVLERVRPATLKPGEVIFRGLRAKPISDTAVRNLLRKISGDDEVTTHGWRSTFRDWVAEDKDRDATAAEQALGHKAGDAVVTAYLRSDMFERRIKLMAEWAAYLAGTSPEGDVEAGSAED